MRYSIAADDPLDASPIPRLCPRTTGEGRAASALASGPDSAHTLRDVPFPARVSGSAPCSSASVAAEPAGSGESSAPGTAACGCSPCSGSAPTGASRATAASGGSARGDGLLWGLRTGSVRPFRGVSAESPSSVAAAGGAGGTNSSADCANSAVRLLLAEGGRVSRRRSRPDSKRHPPAPSIRSGIADPTRTVPAANIGGKDSGRIRSGRPFGQDLRTGGSTPAGRIAFATDSSEEGAPAAFQFRMQE